MSEVRSKKIREAARGESCTLRLPGFCKGDPATTVAAHSPWGRDGMGKGVKSSDLAVCFACIDCHDVLDGRRKQDEIGIVQLQADFGFANRETLRRLEKMGVLKV